MGRDSHEETSRSSPVHLSPFNFSELSSGLPDGDISLHLEIFNFSIERTRLSLGVSLLFQKIIDVFILLVDLIELEVSLANLFDLLDHVLFNWVVVEENFCDGLVDFEGIFKVFANFSSEKIVAEAQTLKGCVWTLNHVEEFLGDVLGFDLAF